MYSNLYFVAMSLLFGVDEDVDHSFELFEIRHKEPVKISSRTCGKTGLYFRTAIESHYVNRRVIAAGFLRPPTLHPCISASRPHFQPLIKKRGQDGLDSFIFQLKQKI
jgi:hypothetical protein